MSETTPNDQQPNAAQGPIMRVMSQYLKDLSFESPGAPQSLMSNLPAPEVEVGVDVNARRLGNDQYEVELSCSANSTREGQPVFLVETNYAGLFLIQNINEQQLEPLLLVEAPRLLFPFARTIVANATREGGFPPLQLEPLDFHGMYLAQRAQAAAGAEAAGPNGNA